MPTGFTPSTVSPRASTRSRKAPFRRPTLTAKTPSAVLAGSNPSHPIFPNVVINADQYALNYNFAEQPAPGATAARGQAAGIGFWQNKNGQALINQFTSIGRWLAATMPRTFGALANASSQQVAALYQHQFVLKDKLDAQVMATALNHQLARRRDCPEVWVQRQGVRARRFDLERWNRRHSFRRLE